MNEAKGEDAQLVLFRERTTECDIGGDEEQNPFSKRNVIYW